MVWINVDRCLIMGHGFLEFALAEEYIAQIDMGLAVLMAQAYHAAAAAPSHPDCLACRRSC